MSMQSKEDMNCLFLSGESEERATLGRTGLHTIEPCRASGSSSVDAVQILRGMEVKIPANEPVNL